MGVRSRPASRGSTYFNRIASEDAQALTSQYGSLGGSRGSMVLYRLATDDNEMLMPPRSLPAARDSVASSSGDSIFSLSSDSKYPSGLAAGRGPFVPYAFDPDLDMMHVCQCKSPYMRQLELTGVLEFPSND